MKTDTQVSQAFCAFTNIHEELQAAYKESQGKIATFEKVLRERTPLGSIDEVDDFGNYLNTLSMRTNVGCSIY
jgi:hypothetical protein